MARRLKLLSAVEGSLDLFRFYSRMGRNRLLDIGLVTALAAYSARAVAGGYLVPKAMADVASFIGSGSGRYLTLAMLLFVAAAATYAATEWLFRPFWDGIAEAIVVAKLKLTSRGRGRLPPDAVGSLTNDVDFIMWNLGNFYNTFTPNALSYLVSLATVFSYSTLAGLANLALLAPSLALIEAYVERVDRIREEERRQYGASIYYANRLLYDGDDPAPLTSSLRSWRRAISGNILLDRVYWSAGLAIAFVAPAITASLMAFRRAAALVGATYASLNAYSSLVNGLYGVAYVGQNRPAIRRVLGLAALSGRGLEEAQVSQFIGGRGG